MTNTPCENAYTALNGAFAERGLAGAVRITLAEQERREIRTRLENPSAYIFEDIMQGGNSSKYRTGNEDGRSFMTVDDLLRLYEDEDIRRRDRRTCVLSAMGSETAGKRMRFDCRPAHAYGISTAYPMESGKLSAPAGMNRETVFDGNRETEMAVEPTRGKLIKKVADAVRNLSGNIVTIKEKRTGRKTAATIAAVSLCFVFTLVLALPIALSVMINNESTELGTLKDSLRAKTAEVQSLEIELDRKNDRFILEDLAVNKYGMIELNLSAYKVMTVNAGDSVEVIDEEKKDTGGAVLALLSALGIRKSDD